jgi:beta-N-acetylhexosaminidase
LTQAQVQSDWQPSEASELRRLVLLPQFAAIPWDDLMVHCDYMHALDLLP